MLSNLISSVFKQEHAVELQAGDGGFEGKVVVRKKGFIDLNDRIAHVADGLSEAAGRRITLRLVSADRILDASNGIGIMSPEIDLADWSSIPNTLVADDGHTIRITFPVDRRSFGKPGALIVTNHHPNEFYLDSVTISPSEEAGKYDDAQEYHFPCKSWVYNTEGHAPRVFFSDKVYLPSETPVGIRALRDAELEELRGDGTGERKERDRIYDYDVYNDLGDPDKGQAYARPTLGGSAEYPYPRRCRTGRVRNDTDPETEKPTSTLDLIYIPRDEVFDRVKTADFLASSVKAIAHILIPAVENLFTGGRDQFESLEAVNALYTRGLDLTSPFSSLPSQGEEKSGSMKSRFELITELTSDQDSGDTSLLKFPLPKVIEASSDAWDTDEEFARQAIGGMHPIIIERLKVFPPVSALDPKVYGPSSSSITAEHIEPYLEGLTAQEALAKNRLYMLDYHDVFLPYVERINALEGSATYASRTLFYLMKKGTLMPVAIELSLHSGDEGRVDRVFVPPRSGDEDDDEGKRWLWKLAKTHAILNDTPVHQLVSHLLRTHVCIEPIVIASHRQLSSMHPISALLAPHFKNTLNINALARKVLINAYNGSTLSGGIVERTFTAGRYALELSSAFYKAWRFDEQGLPSDLIKRGMAVRDPGSKHGLRLVIEDYPYAVDGLDIWAAIEAWADEYVRIFYGSDGDVAGDAELQGWWREAVERGHADKRREPWWPRMDGIASLAAAAATIVWLASAHHAAVNFGQYPFAGYMPCRPTMGRRPVPLPGTPPYLEMAADPTAFLMSTLPSPFQTTVGLAIVEVLSTHASDEVYLGGADEEDLLLPDSPDSRRRSVRDAFDRFRARLADAERSITLRNRDPALVNRSGHVRVPYTLLLPRSQPGITNRGIPNSISI